MRRGFILGLALGLAGLGPAPLSACALFTSKLAECESPRTETRCERMDLGTAGTQIVAAQGTPCCAVQAPLPESQYKASNLSLAVTPVVAPDSLENLPPFENERRLDVLPSQSPPPLQSLLCTFLI